MNEQEYYDMTEKHAIGVFLRLVEKELTDKLIKLINGDDEYLLVQKGDTQVTIDYEWNDDLTDEENFKSIAKVVDEICTKL
jgi:hypothetical protein